MFRNLPGRFLGLRRDMICASRLFSAAVLISSFVVAAPACRADRFTYRDRDDETQVVEAKLITTALDTHVVALPDGEYRLIPKFAVIKHEVEPGPDPMTPAEAAIHLEDRFGSARFRSYVDDPFVVGLVMSAELPKSSEFRARNFLRKVAGFMDKVSGSFKGYLSDLRVPVKEPEYPLVVLIFESDADFDKYMADTTQTEIIFAKDVAGFYSGLTNYLAIRLRTCSTFEVPLHEAIHQQVYNRNFFQRLAPIPHWFDEGIATGFEANGGRINVGPTKISRRYARQALAGRQLSWKAMLNDDKVFQGNVLVGEAYGQAWGLHWLLVTKHRHDYLKYVKLLAQKQPLEQEPEGRRDADIRDAFGQDISELQKEFKLQLEVGMMKQKVSLNEPEVAGKSVTDDGMARVRLTAVTYVDQGGQLEVSGDLTNMCPYRDLAFYVTVETDSGMYAQWYLPDVGILKRTPLKRQFVDKIMPGGARSASNEYRVRIRYAPVGSSDAEKWAAGEFPVPELGQP